MKLDLDKTSENKLELDASIVSSCTIRKFRKGDILFNKGDVSSLTYVQAGIIGLVNLSLSGHESLLRVFGDKSFLGYRSFIAYESYNATAIALTDGEFLTFPYQSSENLLEVNRPLFFHLSKMLARDLRISEERFNDVTGKRVTSRITETLIYLKQHHPTYQWTRREIGEFCGAKTETVTRALSKLEKLGLINKVGREIHLHDINALLEYAASVDFD